MQFMKSTVVRNFVLVKILYLCESFISLCELNMYNYLGNFLNNKLIDLSLIFSLTLCNRKIKYLTDNELG